MNKWMDPKLWTVFIGGAISVVNAYFGWDIDPDKFIATTTVIVSYLFTQGIVDRKRAENGVVRYSFNSAKFAVMVFVSVIMGFSQLVGLDIPQEWIWSGVVGALAFFGVKGSVDIKAASKMKGEVQSGDDELDYIPSDNR